MLILVHENSVECILLLCWVQNFLVRQKVWQKYACICWVSIQLGVLYIYFKLSKTYEIYNIYGLMGWLHFIRSCRPNWKWETRLRNEQAKYYRLIPSQISHKPWGYFVYWLREIKLFNFSLICTFANSFMSHFLALWCLMIHSSYGLTNVMTWIYNMHSESCCISSQQQWTWV